MRVSSSGNERLMEQLGLHLLHREDLTPAVAGIASRHRSARVTHAAALRHAEGDDEFELQSRYRAVAEQLYVERRLSHFLFVAQKAL